MAFQSTETVQLGELQVSGNRTLILSIPNLGSSMALVIYDPRLRLGGVAHIILPESGLGGGTNMETPAKFADIAVPALLEAFTEAGGKPSQSVIRLVGGAQMFNFGGGGASLLNMGSRNATAIKTALSKLGLTPEKTDIGGNKGKSLRFVIATGQLYVKQIGGTEYLL